VRRLLVITDHRALALLVTSAIRRENGAVDIACAGSALPLASTLSRFAPHVVLLDDGCERTRMLQRLREATAEAPHAKRVVFAREMGERWSHVVFDAGADAIVSQQVAPRNLWALLTEIGRGTVVHRFEGSATEPPAGCMLTPREFEVLRLAAAGHTNVRIASELSVTVQTVKFHLSRIYRKLGVANRTQASGYAHLHQLFELPRAS
jgi:DNA-binding NarL/FixJ family response regulator